MTHFGQSISALFLFFTGGTFIVIGEESGDFISNFNSLYVLRGEGDTLQISLDSNDDSLNIDTIADITEMNEDTGDALTDSDVSTTSDSATPEPTSSSSTNSSTERTNQKTCTQKTVITTTGKTTYSGPKRGAIRGVIDSRTIGSTSDGYEENTETLNTTITRNSDCSEKVSYTTTSKKVSGQGRNKGTGWGGQQKTYGNENSLSSDLRKLLVK